MNKQKMKLIMGFALLNSLLAFSTFAVEVGDKAPCVVLSQVHTDGSETEGCIRDVVDNSHAFTVLEFFSIDCSACAENLPKLQAIRDELSDRATFRLVSIDKDETRVRDFIKQQNPLMTVALDLERDAKMGYHVSQTPTLVILGRNNTIYYRHSGVLEAVDIQRVKNILGL